MGSGHSAQKPLIYGTELVAAAPTAIQASYTTPPENHVFRSSNHPTFPQSELGGDETAPFHQASNRTNSPSSRRRLLRSIAFGWLAGSGSGGGGLLGSVWGSVHFCSVWFELNPPHFFDLFGFNSNMVIECDVVHCST